MKCTFTDQVMTATETGLKKSTCRLVFKSASSCRASENVDGFAYSQIFLVHCNAGQVPDSRYISRSA